MYKTYSRCTLVLKKKSKLIVYCTSPEYKNTSQKISRKRAEYFLLFSDCYSTSILTFNRLVQTYSGDSLGISSILVVLVKMLTVGVKLYLFPITFPIITAISGVIV